MSASSVSKLNIRKWLLFSIFGCVLVMIGQIWLHPSLQSDISTLSIGTEMIADMKPRQSVAILVPSYLPFWHRNGSHCEPMDELEAALETWAANQNVFIIFDTHDYTHLNDYFIDATYGTKRIQLYPLIYGYAKKATIAMQRSIYNNTIDLIKPPKFLIIKALSQQLTDKILKTILFISNNRYLSTQYRFYLKTDTDAYVNIPRLRKFLSCVDDTQNWYFGSNVVSTATFGQKIRSLTGTEIIWSQQFQKSIFAPVVNRCLKVMNSGTNAELTRQYLYGAAHSRAMAEDQMQGWCFAYHNYTTHLSIAPETVIQLPRDRSAEITDYLTTMDWKTRRCALVYHRIYAKNMPSIDRLVKNEWKAERNDTLLSELDVCITPKSWRKKRWLSDPIEWSHELIHHQYQNCKSQFDAYSQFFD